MRTPSGSRTGNGQPDPTIEDKETPIPPGIRPEDAEEYRQLRASGFQPRFDPGHKLEDSQPVVPRIQSPGRMIPGSEAGLPSNPPGDEAFAPTPLPRPTRPAKSPARRPTGPVDDEPAEPGKLAPGDAGHDHPSLGRSHPGGHEGDDREEGRPQEALPHRRQEAEAAEPEASRQGGQLAARIGRRIDGRFARIGAGRGHACGDAGVAARASVAVK